MFISNEFTAVRTDIMHNMPMVMPNSERKERSLAARISSNERIRL